tara:strand:- start:341 stop:739 length:399 start_codon:yes stop_codon:yes gene_type:complete
MKKQEITKQISDSSGNKIIASNNGERIKVLLKLNAELRCRLLGYVNIKSKTIKIIRKKELHLLRKNNSYGFNHTLLADAKMFNKILLKDEFNSWSIPTQFILDNGKFLFFKEQGFEKQIFVSLEELNQFKTK